MPKLEGIIITIITNITFITIIIIIRAKEFYKMKIKRILFEIVKSNVPISLEALTVRVDRVTPFINRYYHYYHSIIVIEYIISLLLLLLSLSLSLIGNC